MEIFYIGKVSPCLPLPPVILTNNQPNMRKIHMNVLAIFPKATELKAFEPMPPLGMAWIAASIKDKVNELLFIDQQVDNSTSVCELAISFKPDFILIGGTSHSRFEAFSLASMIKMAYPPGIIVYGGPHASFTPLDTLLNNPSIDIIVHCEGELTMIDLIQWKKEGGSGVGLTKIPGISYRQNGQVRTNKERAYIKNLDLLPDPAREFLPMNKYGSVLDYLNVPATSLITARGCPIKCSFCSASRMFCNHYAYRSAGRIADEVEGLITNYNIQGLKIFDSTFTLKRSHVISFCEELQKRKIVIPWECEIRVGSVDRSLLEIMRKAGCYYIDVGIESGDQATLDRMHKQIRLSDCDDLLRWTSELGMFVKAFFSIGHIGETYQSGKKTINFIRSRQDQIKMIILNPGIRIYPGTELEEYATKENLLPDSFNWSSPFENLLNNKLFLPVNSVPILIQPQLNIKHIRKLRLRYLILRALSIRHVLFRIQYHGKYNQLWTYIRSIIFSIFAHEQSIDYSVKKSS